MNLIQRQRALVVLGVIALALSGCAGQRRVVEQQEGPSRDSVVVRFYRVNLSQADGVELVDLIKQAVAPDTWYDPGEQGDPFGEETEPEQATNPKRNPWCWIAYRSGVVLISHTPEVHALVVQFLEPWRP